MKASQHYKYARIVVSHMLYTCAHTQEVLEENRHYTYIYTDNTCI